MVDNSRDKINMKLTFKELVSGEAYQRAASAYCANMIFVSSITLIYNFFVSDNATLFSSLIFWFPWCVFGVGMFVAAPVYILNMLIITTLSGHTEYPSGIPINNMGKFLKLLSSMWLFFGFFLSVYTTNKVIDYFGL